MSHIMSHILWFALTFIDWVETPNWFISEIKGGAPSREGKLLFIKLTFEICECELRTKRHAAQLNKEIKISSI